MQKLIEEIKLKADSIPTNTKENRRAKGAYVDCLLMAQKQASKNLVLADVSGTSSLHHCGNELTEKEIFYDHCLKCSEYLSED